MQHAVFCVERAGKILGLRALPAVRQIRIAENCR
jgi:hypothetical protein